jgi:hypothetical protein
VFLCYSHEEIAAHSRRTRDIPRIDEPLAEEAAAAACPELAQMRPQLMSAVPPLLEHMRTYRCIVGLCNWCRRDRIVWLAPLPFSSKDILGGRSTKPAHPV